MEEFAKSGTGISFLATFTGLKDTIFLLSVDL